MVNSVNLGSGSSAPAFGSSSAIAESNNYLMGNRGAGGDTLSLSTHGQKKRPSVETLIKGALGAAAAVLSFRFLRKRSAAKKLGDAAG